MAESKKKKGPIRIPDNVLAELKGEQHRIWLETGQEPTYGELIERAWGNYKTANKMSAADSHLRVPLEERPPHFSIAVTELTYEPHRQLNDILQNGMPGSKKTVTGAIKATYDNDDALKAQRKVISEQAKRRERDTAKQARKTGTG